jgi:hypothetical protein
MLHIAMSSRSPEMASTATPALPWRSHQRRRVGSPLIGSTRSSSWHAPYSAGPSFLLLASVSRLSELVNWRSGQASIAYSGYSTRSSGLASFILSVYVVCVCSIQWWLTGYTLAYGESSGVHRRFPVCVPQRRIDKACWDSPRLALQHVPARFRGHGLRHRHLRRM